MLSVCDFIQVYLFTTNHHLKNNCKRIINLVVFSCNAESLRVVSENKTKRKILFFLHQLLLLLCCCCFTSTVNIYGHIGTVS